MLARLSKVLLVVAPFVLAACSSSSDSGPSGPGSANLAPFAKYCTGTLKVDKALKAPLGPGGWSSSATQAAAGSTILVAGDFGKFGGYVIQADGTPMQVDADFMKGLIKDTDFTSSCATDANAGRLTLLSKATFYGKADLSGTPCTFDAGTQFSGYSFSGGGDVGQMSSPDIKAKCGFDTSYTKDLRYGNLITLAK